MKGLLISLLVVIVVAAIGVGVSVMIHVNLTESVETARADGTDEGHADGYDQGMVEGSIAGYQDGSKLGYQTSSSKMDDSEDMQNLFFIYNPTSEEVQKILDNEDLNSMQKVIDYTVLNGIRAAYVRCETVPVGADEIIRLYELVGFDTVDKGFVIIDTWIHKEVQVEKGISYSELNGLPTPSFDDTIEKITIVW